jgi:hypothetical protein
VTCNIAKESLQPYVHCKLYNHIYKIFLRKSIDMILKTSRNLSFISLIFRSYTPLPRHRGIWPGFLYGYKIWFFTLRKGIDSVCFGCYGEYVNLSQNRNKDYGYICRTRSHNKCNLHRIFSEIKSKKEQTDRTYWSSVHRRQM